MEPSSSLISFQDVSFEFGDTQVIENASFTVFEGSFTAITGPNGGGKSTLLKLILNFFSPSSGQITLWETHPSNSLHRIGYVPQITSINDSVPLTVRDVVLMGVLSKEHMNKPYSAKDHEAVHSALEHVGMLDMQHRLLTELSGGQRQRVLIARGIVSAPDLLLLDEPLSNIDPAWQTHLYDLLEELQSEHHINIMLVTHDFTPIVNQITQVLCVNRTVTLHEPQDVYNHTHIT